VSDAEVYVVNVQDEADRYISHIEEALSSVDSDEIRQHIREAIPVGQTLMDALEDLLNSTEDPDMADRAEEAMHHLGMSLDEADRALESPDEDIEDILSEMRRYAEHTALSVSQLS
jgi:hypothetical protein